MPRTLELFSRSPSREPELTNEQLRTKVECLEFQLDSIHHAHNIRIDQAMFATEARLGITLEKAVDVVDVKQKKKATKDRLISYALAIVCAIGATLISRLMGV